jgi:hypothetical protein
MAHILACVTATQDAFRESAWAVGTFSDSVEETRCRCYTHRVPVDVREPRRRAAWIAALAVCCAAAAGCTSSKPASTPTEGPTPAHLPEDQVRRLQDDLTSGIPARVRRAVELPARQRLDPAFVDQLAGVTIDLDVDTAVISGDDQVSATATITRADGTGEQWQVTLDHLDGTYKIADTRRAGR